MTDPISIVAQACLTANQQREALNLWNEEYPAAFAYASEHDFDAYLATQADALHLAATNARGELIGWAFTFTRQGERWFGIMVSRALQRTGLGTQLLQMLKENEPVLHGWVADQEGMKTLQGSTYRSPWPFYQRNGFTADAGTGVLSGVTVRRITWARSETITS